MLKRIFSILIACVLLSMSVSALADPIVSDGEYTAYLGENNNLFLIDPTGSAKVLRSTIIDLVGMDTENLFCLTAEGRLYAILLDGSSTAIVSATPTDEDIETHRGYFPYILDSNLLTLTNPEAGTDGLISTTALAACSNGVDVFYIESDSKGVLKSVPVNGSEAPEDIAYAAEHPVSMHASVDSVAIVTDDQCVIVISLDDGARYPFPAIAETVTDAVSINGTLFRYAATDRGYMLVSEESNGIAVSATQTDLSSTKTNATTAPQATSYPVVTARPTPRPTTHHYVNDGSISYGARGSEVKKMQTRLIALGYPVDAADGRFGPITLVAVKCFQHAIGYRERSTATYSMLQKLYAKDAPVFNACEPVIPGARGIHVTLLQEALKALGFDPGKIDGRYGDMTKAAVAAYQQSVGLTVTGIADTTTLMYLYQKLPDPTATPTAVPTPSFTPAPTVVPTATPTVQPTEAPTEAPTEEPAQPTATPTAAPTAEPTEEPVPTATPAPTKDPATTTDL